MKTLTVKDLEKMNGLSGPGWLGAVSGAACFATGVGGPVAWALFGPTCVIGSAIYFGS